MQYLNRLFFCDVYSHILTNKCCSFLIVILWRPFISWAGWNTHFWCHLRRGEAEQNCDSGVGWVNLRREKHVGLELIFWLFCHRKLEFEKSSTALWALFYSVVWMKSWRRGDSESIFYCWLSSKINDLMSFCLQRRERKQIQNPHVFSFIVV